MHYTMGLCVLVDKVLYQGAYGVSGLVFCNGPVWFSGSCGVRSCVKGLCGSVDKVLCQWPVWISG
jgi:hypothetical protein